MEAVRGDVPRQGLSQWATVDRQLLKTKMSGQGT